MRSANTRSRDSGRRDHSAEPAIVIATDSVAATPTAARVERRTPKAWTADTSSTGSTATASVARTTYGQ
jgi:hypothetical protein